MLKRNAQFTVRGYLGWCSHCFDTGCRSGRHLGGEGICEDCEDSPDRRGELLDTLQTLDLSYDRCEGCGGPYFNDHDSRECAFCDAGEDDAREYAEMIAYERSR